MKKIGRIFLLSLMAVLFAAGSFAGCASAGGSGGGSSDESSGSAASDSASAPAEVTDREAIGYAFGGVYLNGELEDEERGFAGAEDVSSARLYCDGGFVEAFPEFTARTDAKAEFYNGEYVKMVDYSGGMTYCLPADEMLEIDYSIAHYRLQISLGDSLLTVSAEYDNPYGNTASSWEIYREEWLLRFIDDDGYIEKNNLERIGEVIYNDTQIKPGYDVYHYAVHIKNDANIEYPYYNVAVVRKASDYVNFGLFVMKSKYDRTEDMLDIVDSYAAVYHRGTAKNYYDAGEPVEDENWNEETAAYFRSLSASEKVNWGFFSYSMNDESAYASDAAYREQYDRIRNIQAEIEETMGYEFDIYPTYNHLTTPFPTSMAEDFAGGNGENGRPVLQFTYQFTVDNNTFAENGTPMFDILRGRYDHYFRNLARAIKAYGKPVLFRLNNEMNTDWVSYCGLVTLLDPDIFVMAWQQLYSVFEEEGVDNCIWIWNPAGVSCPYSSWGEDLCYFPGTEYVQVLGLTDYEMGNGDVFTSFESYYSSLYEKNTAFRAYPAIISEFACGSGGNASGALGRNAAKQAAWVEEMFAQINAGNPAAYVRQIKGAVWFNCNDYDGDMRITNRLKIVNADNYLGEDYSDLAATTAAFREGLSGA